MPVAYNGYDLIAGERRLRAHELLMLDTIEATIIDVDDRRAALIAAAENIQRENLSPMEEADAIDKALAESSLDEVAAAFGRSHGYIARRHQLLQLSLKWRKAVEDGFAKEYSQAALIEIARAPEDIQKMLFDNYWQGYNGDPTAEAIRDMVFKDEHFLSAAAFDTSECLKCQRSTCATPTLFDDFVTNKKGDRCMDDKCWTDKSTAAIEAKVEEFKKENPAGVMIGADYTVSLPHDHSIKKQNIPDWEYTAAKKSDKGTVSALNIKTGKIMQIKLTGNAQKAAAKHDEDGKLNMKEKRARLEKRRVIRYIEKIIAVIEDMVKREHEFPYAAIVPLVAIFGAVPLPDKKDLHSYQNPLDKKFNDDHCQKELFRCIAPNIIAELYRVTKSENPEKKRGDVFREWLGIGCDTLYAAAVEEIPEPKSWAKEGPENKAGKKTEAKERA
jgi:hypothetical protein